MKRMLLATACLLAAHAAHGQSNVQAPEPSSAPRPSPGEPGFTTQLFASSRSNLLGDMFGLRPALGTLGMTLGIVETSELFGNVTGGTRTGFAYDGLTTLTLGVDLDQAFGWDGATFNVSAFQIHGRYLSVENLATLNTASGIEANRATRLWELWVQQELLDGRADVKIGQQSLDQEFIISQGASLFINTALGWPVLPSFDQYAGGPAYPLASLGVRLRAKPVAGVTVLAGVFDDNPAGGPFDDDGQLRGAAQSGTAFHLGTGALLFSELQYAINQPAEGDAASPDGGGLPGTYKLGAWFDTGTFQDQRIDTLGRSLSDPASNGIPRSRRNDFSVYGVADQTVWQPDPDGARSVSVFTRLMGAPDDRNLISFGANVGAVLKAPLPDRDNDSFGIAWVFGQVGRRASLRDKDSAALAGVPVPVRSSESVIEIMYQAQVAPWWTIQPDFQYVFLPGAGIADPGRPGQRVGNEAVFGIRTNVTF